MDDLKLEIGNALKSRISWINSGLSSLKNTKKEFSEVYSSVELYLSFRNVKPKSYSIGVDKKLTGIIIETTIDYLEQTLDTLKKEYEEL